MVKFWDKQINDAIKRTKFRIKHHEKHGNGDVAMQDKRILLKQERNKKLHDAK